VGGLGCDNMTVVLVCLLHNQPWSSLVARCGGFQLAKDAAARQEMEEELRLAEQEADEAAKATRNDGVPDGPASSSDVVHNGGPEMRHNTAEDEPCD